MFHAKLRVRVEVGVKVRVRVRIKVKVRVEERVIVDVEHPSVLMSKKLCRKIEYFVLQKKKTSYSNQNTELNMPTIFPKEP